MAQLSLSERESLIVALVTRAFEGMNLQVVTMNRSGPGGQMEVLRFTLDDAYSSELAREQISTTGQSPEELATTVENDLRSQMPASA
jgi:hypothetical protein